MEKRFSGWHVAIGSSLGVAIGFVFAFALLVFISSESYFWFYPAIDTNFAPGFSEEGLDSIKVGMTQEQVIQELGEPLRRFEIGKTGKPYPTDTTSEEWSYSSDGRCEWGDFAWLGRSVYFDIHGEVTAIEREIFYD